MAELLDDWAKSTVADEFHVQLGKRLDAAVNRGEPRRCINNRGVRWGKVISAESIIAPLTMIDIRELRLKTGDVLMCEGGEIGRASVWRNELPEAYFLNTLHRLRSKGGYEPGLLVAFFERWAATGELLALVGKSSLAHLTKENLLRVTLPVPPEAEQNRITSTLQVAEQEISALERLIAKKQAIKQGMMQQLLTGKTRLPGFTEPWTRAGLGSIATVTMGQSPPGSSYNSRGYGIPLIQGNADIHNRTTFDRIWTTAPTKDCNADDILLTVRAPVGYTAVASKDSCVGRGVCALNTHDYGNRFMFHALVYAEPAWALYEQGSTFTSVDSSQVRSFAIDWPLDAEERNEIASVLDEADCELAALKSRLTKAREIKTGMMQELLTGRTRLPVEATS